MMMNVSISNSKLTIFNFNSVSNVQLHDMYLYSLQAAMFKKIFDNVNMHYDLFFFEFYSFQGNYLASYHFYKKNDNIFCGKFYEQ